MYGRVSQLDDDIENDMADIDVDDDANTVNNNRSDCDIDFIVFTVVVIYASNDDSSVPI